MAEKKKVRVGFVGVGSMGQCAHLRNYAALPEECEVVALAEIRPELGKRVAAKYGVPKAYTSHEEMLEKEQIDALVASQPFSRHGVLLSELLRTGRPVFSEKPLAASIETGEKIIQAEKEGKTFLMVGYHKRSDPATMYGKEKIEACRASGELGKFKYVRILMPAGDWVAGGFNDMLRSQEPMPPLEWDPKPAGMDETAAKLYESFVNYYIHQINLMRHILGEAYHVKYADPSGVVLAVESESGVPGVIEMTPYHTSIDWQEHALACFERGYVKIDLPAPVALNRPGTVEILRDLGKDSVPETIVPKMPWVHAMRQQAINFIRAVRGEAKPLCTATEALEDLKNAREYLKVWKGV